MNPLAELSASFRGWAEIVAGRSGGQAHFRTGAAGLWVAIATLVIAMLLSVAAQSSVSGMPGAGQLLLGLLAQAITVAMLGAVMAQTLKFLRLAAPLNALLVPALYGLAYVFVLAVPLMLFGPMAGLLAILGFGVLMQRLGAVVAGMALGLSIAFGLLCVIVLVVVPNALYMLLLLFPSA